SHFDETHPAITRRAKLLVIAISRDENANPLARLDHACAFGKLMPDAVDLDVQELRCWRWLGHLSSLNCARVRRFSIVITITSTIPSMSMRVHLNRSFRAGFFPALVVGHGDGGDRFFFDYFLGC